MLDVRPHNDNNEDKWQDLKSKEMQYLNELLAFCDGDKARAAHIAGISLRSFYRKFGVVR